MASRIWWILCASIAGCGPAGGEQGVASRQLPEQHGLMLRAEAIQDRLSDPGTVLLSVTVVNPTKDAIVFVDYPPFYSYEVRGPAGEIVPPVEGDIVLASGADPVTIMPGDSLRRVVNLACIGLSRTPERARGESDACYLRFDLSARGAYHVVVAYRAPRASLDFQRDEFVELQSNRVVLQN